jgi:hypothetical protein
MTQFYANMKNDGLTRWARSAMPRFECVHRAHSTLSPSCAWFSPIPFCFAGRLKGTVPDRGGVIAMCAECKAQLLRCQQGPSKGSYSCGSTQPDLQGPARTSVAQ